MSVRIAPYTPAEMVEVAAFNARLEAANPGDGFPLPASPAANHPDETAPIRFTHLLALDQSQHVRGGFLQMDQCAWLNGQVVTATNYQSPVSEGLWNPAFTFVAMQMLKSFQQRSPYAFIVGMGHPERSLPRLLAAAGWTVRPVPFFFSIVHPARVLRHLAILRRSRPVRLACQIAALSGASWIGNQLLRARATPARLQARRFTIEPTRRWGTWADEIWSEVKERQTFAVSRTGSSLQCLYPVADARHTIFLIARDGRPCGWAVCLLTPMHAHKDFGDLTVGTVLDCMALPDAEGAVATLAARALAHRGADLVITNQSHVTWQTAFARAGFLAGPSNYLLATSRPLSAAITASGPERVHIVRGDGDGRIHL